ncbi:MAG: hypothetical protein M3154_05960 [Candidatus Eremiobacteraeota bacterium]|nr:hypothetical protein [Candidatus Eremiobacteraeota bacterium]
MNRFPHALTAAVLALFAARFGVAAMHDPPSDGDLAWQRWLGERILSSGTLPTRLGTETFSAAGSPWLPHEWLFGILTAAAQRVALDRVFDLAVALCAVLALTIVARRAAAAGASAFATTLCVLLAGVAMFDSFGVRAQVVAWPLLAAFLALLEGGAWWLPVAAVTTVWANVHASAVLSPVVAVAWAAGVAVRDRFRGGDVVRASVAAVAAFAALAINPFGFRLVTYAASLVGSPIKGFITEWQPTTFADASFTFGALPLLFAAGAWMWIDGRRSPQVLCVLAVGLVLMVSASRNIPIFALVAAPYAALGFTRLLGSPAAAHDGRRERVTSIAALCVVVLAAVTAVSMWRTPNAPDDTGTLIARLAAETGTQRLFCQDYSWCGAAVGRSRIRVFLDGRADPYPLPVWRAEVRIAHALAGWQQTLLSYGVDAIIAERRSPLGDALARSDRWVPTASAGPYALFVRHVPDVHTGRRANQAAGAQPSGVLQPAR